MTISTELSPYTLMSMAIEKKAAILERRRQMEIDAKEEFIRKTVAKKYRPHLFAKAVPIPREVAEKRYVVDWPTPWDYYCSFSLEVCNTIIETFGHSDFPQHEVDEVRIDINRLYALLPFETEK